MNKEHEDVNRPASELLFDSETALRRVDTALDELQGASELPNAMRRVAPRRDRTEPPTVPAAPSQAKPVDR